MLKRKIVKPVFYGLMLSAGLGFGAARANAQSMEIVEVRRTEVVPLPADQFPAEADYCHYKFPSAISVDPGNHGSGGTDVVDYYGTCDQREARNDQIQHEQNQTAYQWETNYES